MNSLVLWFTGLSSSGKTTIANELCKRLERKGKIVKILDGDIIRNNIHQDLRFSPEDIKKNNELITQLCLKDKNNCDFILVAVISPFCDSRAKAREIIGEDFVEIYIKVSLEEAIRRDVKGLYKKALAGEIKNFIGLSPDVPYEAPEHPDICIDTEKLAIKDSVQLIYSFLVEKNFF